MDLFMKVDKPSVSTLYASFKNDLPRVLEAEGPEATWKAQTDMFRNAFNVLLPYAAYTLREHSYQGLHIYADLWSLEQNVYMKAINDFRSDEKRLLERIKVLCEYSIFYLLTTTKAYKMFTQSPDKLVEYMDIKAEGRGEMGRLKYEIFFHYIWNEFKRDRAAKKTSVLKKTTNMIFDLHGIRRTSMNSFLWQRTTLTEQPLKFYLENVNKVYAEDCKL